MICYSMCIFCTKVDQARQVQFSTKQTFLFKGFVIPLKEPIQFYNFFLQTFGHFGIIRKLNFFLITYDKFYS